VDAVDVAPAQLAGLVDDRERDSPRARVGEVLGGGDPLVPVQARRLDRPIGDRRRGSRCPAGAEQADGDQQAEG
jgi:hypothetical protein